MGTSEIEDVVVYGSADVLFANILLLPHEGANTSEPRNALDGAVLRAVASATPAMFGELLLNASVVGLICDPAYCRPLTS